MHHMKTMALVVGADLFFKSKIDATARAAGAGLLFATKPEEVAAALEAGGVDVVVINLEAAGLDPLDTVARAKAAGARVACYANHVQEELMSQAREAGCDRVLAKGAFTRELAAILAADPRL